MAAYKSKVIHRMVCWPHIVVSYCPKKAGSSLRTDICTYAMKNFAKSKWVHIYI